MVSSPEPIPVTNYISSTLLGSLFADYSFVIKLNQVLLPLVFSLTMVGPAISHSETPTRLEISVPNRSEVYQNSPEQLSKENNKWSEFYKNNINGVKGATIRFGSTSSAFQIAGLVHVMLRMASEPENEPTMLKNFLTNQVFSTQAQVSLLFLVTGIHLADSQFGKWAERHAWIKNEKHISLVMKQLAQEKSLPQSAEVLTNSKGVHPKLIAEWKKVRLAAEKLVPGAVTARQFQRVSMLASFSVVMPLLTMFSDLLNDPDIQYYGDSLISSQEEIDRMILKKGYTPYAANQRAYDRWVKSNKIMDYTPMLLSAWTSLTLQFFVIPTVSKLLTTGFEKLIGRSSGTVSRMAYRGIEFLNIGKSFIPQSRAISFVGQAVVFVSLNEILNKKYDKLYTEIFYSAKLNSQMTELRTYPLSPQISKDCFQQVSKSPNFNLQTWNSIPYSTAKRTLELSAYADCDELPLSQEEKLDEIAASYSHWRQFWFRASMSSLYSWSDYISQIKSDYLGAYYFYRQFVSDAGEANSSLNTEAPFYGVGAISLKNGRDVQLQALVEIYKTVKGFLSSMDSKLSNSMLTSDEGAVSQLYRHMFAYLTIFDGTIPANLANLIKPIEQSILTSAEKTKWINHYKDLYASKAITTFKKIYPTLAERLSDKNMGNIKTIERLLVDADPKSMGQTWFSDFRFNDYLYLNKDSRFKNKSAFDMKTNDSIEWYYAHLVCSQSAAQAPLKRVSFWSLNFELPSILAVPAKFSCSDLTYRQPFESQTQLKLFESELGLDGKAYLNLIDFGIKNLRPDFKGPDRVKNFESWWATNMAAILNKQIEGEIQKFNLSFKNEVQPSLQNSEKYSGIPKGYLPSIISEIQFYLSQAQSIYPKLATKMNEINENLKLAELIILNPMDKPKWINPLLQAKNENLKNLAISLNSTTGTKESLMTIKLLLNELRDSNQNHLLDLLDLESDQEMNKKMIMKKLASLMGLKLDEAASLLKIREIFLIDGLNSH